MLLTTSFSLALEIHYPLFSLTELSDQDFSTFPHRLFVSVAAMALLFAFMHKMSREELFTV